MAQVLEHLRELSGVRPPHVLGEAAQQVEERANAGGDAFSGCARLELFHQLFEPVGIAHNLEQRRHRRIVELERRTGERGCNDFFERRGITLLFAQDFRIVDFLDFDARSARGSPEVRDASVGPHVLGRSGEQGQERPPRRGVGAGVEGHRSNRVPTEQLGELDDRGVGFGWTQIADLQRAWTDAEVERPLGGHAGGQIGETAERDADGRMRRRVQGDRTDCGLARARELCQARRGVRIEYFAGIVHSNGRNAVPAAEHVNRAGHADVQVRRMPGGLRVFSGRRCGELYSWRPPCARSISFASNGMAATWIAPPSNGSSPASPTAAGPTIRPRRC